MSGERDQLNLGGGGTELPDFTGRVGVAKESFMLLPHDTYLRMRKEHKGKMFYCVVSKTQQMHKREKNIAVKG